MSDSLAEAYLQWLEPQVRIGRGKSQHMGLLRAMREKEFVWLIPNDDNRVRDGLDLRLEFAHETHRYADMDPNDLGPCSILEVLIGLSRKASWASDGEPPDWAGQLVLNLGLDELNDPFTRRKEDAAEDVLDRVVWRHYSPDGRGGFFPLESPKEDQREVELWYQMNAYLEEHERF